MLVLWIALTLATEDADPNAVAATVHGAPITGAEVDRDPEVRRAMRAVDDARAQVLEKLVTERAVAFEAARRGVSVADLLRMEVDDKAVRPSPGAVRAYYDANSTYIGEPFARVRDRLADSLYEQDLEDRRQAFLAAILQAAEVVRNIQVHRESIAARAGAPLQGAADAKVRLTVFSDFQCPYCSRLNPSLAQVTERYGSDVSIEFRHYPLPFHPHARTAAIAAECMHDQGRFWPYHDLIFAGQADLSAEALTRMGAAAGGDRRALEACITGQETANRVDADLVAGVDAGVEGTPATFINGRLVSGAVPFSVFSAIIDEELARLGQ